MNRTLRLVVAAAIVLVADLPGQVVNAATLPVPIGVNVIITETPRYDGGSYAVQVDGDWQLLWFALENNNVIYLPHPSTSSIGWRPLILDEGYWHIPLDGGLRFEFQDGTEFNAVEGLGSFADVFGDEATRAIAYWWDYGLQEFDPLGNPIAQTGSPIGPDETRDGFNWFSRCTFCPESRFVAVVTDGVDLYQVRGEAVVVPEPASIVLLSISLAACRYLSGGHLRKVFDPSPREEDRY
jgi:hypothetical protein